MRLREGDKLRLEESVGSIQLTPVRSKARLHKKKGLWVINSGIRDYDIDAAIDDVREEQTREILK